MLKLGHIALEYFLGLGKSADVLGLEHGLLGADVAIKGAAPPGV